MAAGYRGMVCGDSDNVLLDELFHANERFDLILTDPPYNLGKDFGNDSDKLSMNAFLDVNRLRISKLAQLLTPTGSLLWFGIHHFIGYLQVIMYDAGLHYRRMNIWRYQNGFSRSRRAPRNEYEPFLWFSKSNQEWSFNPDDVRVPYKSPERLKSPVYYLDSKGQRRAWVPNALGSLRGDVWEFPTLAGKRFADERTGHPTQKPKSLITTMLKAFMPKSPKGEYFGRLLDPYAGSGTVGVCAQELNALGHRIDWLCIELEPHWVEISHSRLLGRLPGRL